MFSRKLAAWASTPSRRFFYFSLFSPARLSGPSSSAPLFAEKWNPFRSKTTQERTYRMNEEPKENERPLLDHASDGIQELDNLLPRWWVWLFWICNVFAFLYMLYFHVLNLGDSQAAAYTKD